MFRSETRMSLELGSGADSVQRIKNTLRRTQQVLYDDPSNDWAFMRMWVSKNIVAGSIYYDLPEGINIERIEAVYLIDNTLPIQLVRGIGEEQYLIYDTDNPAIRAYPLENWDIRWTGAATQVEVWPRPSQNCTIKFKGLRPLRPLINDDDVCDLDDNLIVLFAAAEELLAKDPTEANMRMQLARSLLHSKRASASAGARDIQLGTQKNIHKNRFNISVRVT